MIRPNATPLSFLTLAILTGVFACAHAGPSSPNRSRVIREADDFPFPSPVLTSDIISRSEIDTSGVRTAYDVVRQLRPAYLWPRWHRGVEPKAPVAVFIDNVVSGGPEALSAIPANLIQEIRYVLPTQAVDRYGGAYVGGIIIVRLRR